MEMEVIHLQPLHSDYHVKNMENKSCPLCSALNGFFKDPSLKAPVLVPATYGNGSYKRCFTQSGMEVTFTEISFNKKINMAGFSKKPAYEMAFSLGAGLEWKDLDSGIWHRVEPQSTTIFKNPLLNGVCLYEQSIPYVNLGIRMEVEWLEQLLLDTGLSIGLLDQVLLSSEMRHIAHQIQNCSLPDNLKSLWLESKILELMALYFEQLHQGSIKYKQQTLAVDQKIHLKRTDQEALYQIKQLIDQNPLDAYTLKGLSSSASMNEYKLKAGFKHVFGTTVYAYILRKRMEMAKCFLESGRYNVSQVSSLIGYSNASHFSSAFKKIYGLNPKQYLQEIT